MDSVDPRGIMTLLWFAVCLCIVQVYGSITSSPHRWHLGDVRDRRSSVVVPIAPSFIPTAGATNISQQCIDDSQYYYQAVVSLQMKWALHMYESTGSGVSEELVYKLLSSKTIGNTYYELGLFDQCLAVRSSVALDSDGQPHAFAGKYCTMFFDVESTDNDELVEDRVSKDVAPLRQIQRRNNHRRAGTAMDAKRPVNTYDQARHTGAVGICVPSSCSASDLRSAVVELFGHQLVGLSNNVSIATLVEENQCHSETNVDDPQPLWDWTATSMTAALCLLGLLNLLATIYEACRIVSRNPVRPAGERPAVRLLCCFSLISNWRSLASTEPSSTDTLSCLNGIRVLTTAWVVIMHVSQESMYRHIHNRNMLSDAAARWENQFLSNGTVSVDTFFLMSGLLVAYSLTRDLTAHKSANFSLARFYLHRYMRLTPVYAVVLGSIAALAVHLGTGPDWNYVRYMSEDCRNNWWTHLLYVNNYFPAPPTFCMSESWSLAVDMQMFWLSPLIIYPLWRWRRAGLVWAVFNIVAFTGASLAAHVVFDLPPTVMSTRPTAAAHFIQYLRLFYKQMYPRFPAYVLGMLMGSVLYRTKRLSVQIKKSTSALSWTLSLSTGLIVIYCLVPYLREDLVPRIRPLISATYGSMHRLAWAGALSWLIFACVHGYGGYVNRLLSCSAFLPLSRVTYVVYLIHFNYIKMYFSHARQPIYFTTWGSVNNCGGILFTVFVLAAVIHVVIELPFLNLGRILLPTAFSMHKQKKEE